MLGMNRRNADFILPYNKRKYYPLVDNKRITKQLAIEAGVRVPEVYTIIEIERQIQGLHHLLEKHEDFVLKPASGSGGNGIWVITAHMYGRYRKSSGALVKHEEFDHHISNILSGMYSLSGLNDTAIIEYRVKTDPFFDEISYRGVPDIRTIIFRGVPVMAMLRLPTQLSDGKANLHQGAIGVGVDIKTGRTIQGVMQNQLMMAHPDTGTSIKNLALPYWDEILQLSAMCYEFAPLDYMGVDIVIDRDKGPMLLELNARPGLSIQLCNGEGLLHRLQKVAAIRDIPLRAQDRVALGKELISPI